MRSRLKVGYSPERINPGDKEHRLATIVKVVSGMDAETLEDVARTYELVVEAGVHRAPSIKVAEAAKVIENSQRDINIAFVNELSLMFHEMGVDTLEVLEAAGTKWNFLNFKPGLVGGHCIGVDPYYLTHRAEELGYHSQVVLSGRRINDGMGVYVAQSLVKRMIANSVPVKGAKVAILGFAFKEGCPDARNSKVDDIRRELNDFGINPAVCDPVADAGELRAFYGVEPVEIGELQGLDAVVVATAHDCFKCLTPEEISSLYAEGSPRIIADVKGCYDRHTMETAGFDYWRL